MPIYAYRCESCGHAKDVLQKMSDPLLSTCPACGADTFKKQVTAAGFQLKGSGWYATDFKGGGAAPAPAASTPAADAKTAPSADSGSAPSTSTSTSASATTNTSESASPSTGGTASASGS